MIWSRRTAQSTWTPTDNVVPFPKRTCVQVNEQTAGQMLADLSDAELATHVELLQAEHGMKRHALRAAADALARALNEQVKRRER